VEKGATQGPAEGVLQGAMQGPTEGRYAKRPYEAPRSGHQTKFV